jgi:hypothetical protein
MKKRPRGGAFQTATPKHETRISDNYRITDFGFRALGFGFASLQDSGFPPSFGFRISNFGFVFVYSFS